MAINRSPPFSDLLPPRNPENRSHHLRTCPPSAGRLCAATRSQWARDTSPPPPPLMPARPGPRRALSRAIRAASPARLRRLARPAARPLRRHRAAPPPPPPSPPAALVAPATHAGRSRPGSRLPDLLRRRPAPAVNSARRSLPRFACHQTLDPDLGGCFFPKSLKFQSMCTCSRLRNFASVAPIHAYSI